jgi:hypothetical protein
VAGRWHRGAVVGVALVAVALVAVSVIHISDAVAGSGASRASGAASTSTLPEPGQGVPGNIIPEPNSGIGPEEPGDRGGWQQWAVLVAIVAGVGTIGLLVVRESRGRRAARPD